MAKRALCAYCARQLGLLGARDNKSSEMPISPEINIFASKSQPPRTPGGNTRRRKSTPMLIPDEDLPSLCTQPDKPGRSTGPRSPAGKANSSMNRLDHGCRSSKTILRDEDPAEYDSVVASWLGIYQPQDRKEDELVHEVITAHWHLKRCRKRLEEVEYELPGNAWNWTDSHQKLYANFSRYKTTAERSFNRAYKEMEAHRGRQFRDEQIREKARLAAAQVDLTWLNQEQDRISQKQIFEQVVEISVDDQGRCITECFPPNEEILDLIETKPYTPVLMKRTLFFVSEVPPEYAWAQPKPSESGETRTAQQKMSWNRWLALTAREQAQATGHIGPLYSQY